MELELSEEQEEFVSTIRRFLAAECPLPATRELESDAAGFDTSVWARGADLGWTSLMVPDPDEPEGSSDYGLPYLVLVAEEMGRVVAPGPLVPVNVVAEAVGRHGSDAQRAAVLPGLIDGSSIAAWCGPEPVTAGLDGDRLVLSGTVGPVEAGAQASNLLVTVSVEGDDGTRQRGPTQLLVSTDTPGVSTTALGGLDLVRRFATVTFEGAQVGTDSVLGDIGGAAGAIERQGQVACVLQCAESVGAMDRVFEMTVEYLGDRYSFGRPLSSYQALKHRVADDKTWLEAAHAIASAAARAVHDRSPDAGELVNAAKVWIGPQATELVQDCIQLHGGIGVTWEHDLHLYLRRVTVNRASYGTPEHHAEQIATTLLGVAS